MATEQEPNASFFTRFLGVFVYSRRALSLVWTTSRGLTISLAVLTLVAGVLPAVIAYNRYSNQVERLETRYDNFTEEFSSILQRQAHALVSG